jgi:hypothetical protein
MKPLPSGAKGTGTWLALPQAVKATLGMVACSQASKSKKSRCRQEQSMHLVDALIEYAAVRATQTPFGSDYFKDNALLGSAQVHDRFRRWQVAENQTRYPTASRHHHAQVLKVKSHAIRH